MQKHYLALIAMLDDAKDQSVEGLLRYVKTAVATISSSKNHPLANPKILPTLESLVSHQDLLELVVDAYKGLPIKYASGQPLGTNTRRIVENVLNEACERAVAIKAGKQAFPSIYDNYSHTIVSPVNLHDLKFLEIFRQDKEGRSTIEGQESEFSSELAEAISGGEDIHLNYGQQVALNKVIKILSKKGDSLSGDSPDHDLLMQSLDILASELTGEAQERVQNLLRKY